MSRQETTIPGWQRILEQPHILHRLATTGLLVAALLAGVAAFLRGAPEGLASTLRWLTYLADIIAWVIVVLAAAGEAFIAGASYRPRADGRPHYQIVFWIGVVISAILIAAYVSILQASAQQIGLIGRVVKAAIAGMLPLIIGVTLVAGLTILWLQYLQPRLTAHLEAKIRDYEQRQQP